MVIKRYVLNIILLENDFRVFKILKFSLSANHGGYLVSGLFCDRAFNF